MSQRLPTKTQPTLFPFGFSVGKLDDDIIVIDFLDQNSEELTVIGSFALTPKKVEELAKALTQKDE